MTGNISLSAVKTLSKLVRPLPPPVASDGRLTSRSLEAQLEASSLVVRFSGDEAEQVAGSLHSPSERARSAALPVS